MLFTFQWSSSLQVDQKNSSQAKLNWTIWTKIRILLYPPYQILNTYEITKNIWFTQTCGHPAFLTLGIISCCNESKSSLNTKTTKFTLRQFWIDASSNLQNCLHGIHYKVLTIVVDMCWWCCMHDLLRNIFLSLSFRIGCMRD